MTALSASPSLAHRAAAAAPLAAQTLSGFTASERLPARDRRPAGAHREGLLVAGVAHVPDRGQGSADAAPGRADVAAGQERSAGEARHPAGRHRRHPRRRGDDAQGVLDDHAQGLATFKVDGHAYKLQEKPPLLGWQTPETIAAYNNLYVQRADAYKPQAAALADLKKQAADVKLTVFFGSWCPFCQQKVPMVMRMARELAGLEGQDRLLRPAARVRQRSSGPALRRQVGADRHRVRRTARKSAASAPTAGRCPRRRSSQAGRKLSAVLSVRSSDQIDASVSPARARRLQLAGRAHVRHADLCELLAQSRRAAVAGERGALESSGVRPQDRDRRPRSATGWMRTVRCPGEGRKSARRSTIDGGAVERCRGDLAAEERRLFAHRPQRARLGGSELRAAASAAPPPPARRASAAARASASPSV